MESAQSLRAGRAAALIGMLLLALAGAVAGAAADAAALRDADRQAAATVAAAIASEVTDRHVAGAVVLVGDADGVRYRIANGLRTTAPVPQAMTADTIFDLASLTKAVATATAILQLAERGRVALDAPAARYWPAFAAHGKDGITVRQLLAHTSGLPAGVSSALALRSRAAVLADVAAMSPIAPPGARVVYSDINYVALGEIVERASGEPLDAWCATHVFAPLGMHDTRFRPGIHARPRIAPTSARQDGSAHARVNDPIAAAMGGVSGNAGLFSTADDLARFARMLLHDGVLDGRRILQRDSVAVLQTPATLDVAGDARTAGWALQPPLVANRYRLPAAGAIAHLGYTGTGLWIDFVTRRFVIVLTSRLYPAATGDAQPLRAQVLGIVSSRAPPVSGAEVAVRVPAMAAAVAQAARLPASTGTVLAGIDVLAATGFAAVAGKRIGVVTNRSGFDREGRRTIDLLAQAPGARLTAIFAPEHGVNTDVDTTFGDTVDARTNVVVHSLYGDRRRIAPATLSDVDVLVFDLQDAGVRFFTYLATLGYALEAAAAAHIPIVVLDRPDPLGADLAGGPVSDPDPASFTNYYPLPLMHGMTVGELAQLFNDRLRIGAELAVMPMQNYRRGMRFDDTGLGWVPPSPNLRDPVALSLYPDVGLVEGADVSAGRGTATPFGVVGAPWIDGRALADDLRAMHLNATFAPTRFVPAEGAHRGALCEGVRIARTPGPLQPGALGLALALALHRRYPERFRIDAIRASVGSHVIADMLNDGRPLDEIEKVADAQNAVFARERATYLLY
ncbi:exo-beta-N-acetylmuramidase NamZ domain-containing protein [Burkholderia ubonensis]|uniref:Serine hydrolase n=1 Tax=Burkholderia ubonensis TaxID=101571 RepID=A0AAW3N626_9BURK|nr:exo-beta-N-acetylmuramidase NamZ domain-containing protein [Burkholderia ubonensis]KVT41293.1 serine hydrolase [Burkholderia ubonensis]